MPEGNTVIHIKHTKHRKTQEYTKNWDNIIGRTSSVKPNQQSQSSGVKQPSYNVKTELQHFICLTNLGIVN